MNTTTNNEYQENAQKILNNMGVKFTAEFLKHDKHFDSDKETRDIYKITISRGSRSYTFNFGQSINASGKYQIVDHLVTKMWNKWNNYQRCLTEEQYKKHRHFIELGKDVFVNKNFAAPDEYSVFACLTKYSPGTFEDFCSEFGYDQDSRQAEKTYKAVKAEFEALQTLFTDSELEQLNEIQ